MPFQRKESFDAVKQFWVKSAKYRNRANKKELGCAEKYFQ